MDVPHDNITEGDGSGWINVGYETWKALRHEWKYKVPPQGDRPPDKKRKRIDPEVIYTEITGPRKGQLSQPVPLQDLVSVLTWVWESDSVW